MFVTTSLQLHGMNSSSGDNKSQVCLNLVSHPYPQPTAAMTFAVAAAVHNAVSHARDVPLEAQHSTLPRESPWLPRKLHFKTCFWTSLGLKDLYHTTQGQEETPGSAGLQAFRHGELFVAIEPHADAASTHGARPSTDQAAAHRGFVSVCTIKTDARRGPLHV